jgi:two-component system response regulator VicR
MILVADDDRTYTKVLKKFLEDHGFGVLVADDGDDALKVLEKTRPDLLVLDIWMPRMNGYTFLFEMRKHEGEHRIPVIVLTCKQELEDIFRVEGVKEYLIKPVRNEDLLEKIKKYI